MANRVQLLATESFSPGLRLDVDAFQLQDGESPDLMNVDLDPRGGIAMRKAVSSMHVSPTSSGLHSLFTYATVAGTEQLVGIATDGRLYYSTGGNFTQVIGTVFTSGSTVRCRAVTFKDKLYIVGGQNSASCVAWDGSTVSPLGHTFNDNIQSPNGGDMPSAACIAAWQGYVWVADTTESGTRFASRVRFSHPNTAEDWHSLHYIDIDTGKDGDFITALVPLADRLLVFKNRSVHVITGDGPETFSVNFLASVGCPAQEAVVTTEYGVYFFSWPLGLHVFGERGVSYVFDAIYPAIRDGDIPDAWHTKITLGWFGRRVYVSVPWGNSTTNARTFVYTPGKQGGWTQYDFGVGPMVQWKRIASDSLDLAISPINTFVVKLNQNADFDSFGAGGVSINSYYFTRWYDAGSPAVVKRWRRPDIVFDADTAVTLRFDIFKDYDPSSPIKSFTESIVAKGGGTNWNAANWGAFTWGATNQGAQTIERGGLVGRARAVALKIVGPSTSKRWSVNSINFKYIPRPVR